MKYEITNVIDDLSINLLRSIKRTKPLNIYVEEVGELALQLIIESPDKKLCVKNTPVMASDGDDYPKLTIEQAPIAPDDEMKRLYSCIILDEIVIYRVEASWKRNGSIWNVKSDIGLKLVLQQEELLIIAQDSLAGLLRVIKLSNEQSINRILEDYWIMKTDYVDSLIRSELKV